MPEGHHTGDQILLSGHHIIQTLSTRLDPSTRILTDLMEDISLSREFVVEYLSIALIPNYPRDKHCEYFFGKEDEPSVSASGRCMQQFY